MNHRLVTWDFNAQGGWKRRGRTTPLSAEAREEIHLPLLLIGPTVVRSPQWINTRSKMSRCSALAERFTIGLASDVRIGMPPGRTRFWYR